MCCRLVRSAWKKTVSLDKTLAITYRPQFFITHFNFIYMNIYVGNLDYNINDQDLERFFAEYGTVESAKIIIDKYNGRSKGFGFVEMNNEEEAQKAIKELNGATLENREMVVNEARPKTDAPRRRY
jgi:RNA recognition motif-containing protein